MGGRLINTVDLTAPPNICSKRKVCAWVERNGVVYGVGWNLVQNPHAECQKTWGGEPFAICDDTCCIICHAEQMALIQAGRRYCEGSTLYLVGHHWICPSCEEQIKHAGIANVIMLKGVECA
jgi:deoxycytidylate deaminase